MAIRSEKAIESVPFFPAIAWSIFVLFAAFVYLLTAELRQTTAALESTAFANAEILKEAPKVPPVAQPTTPRQ